MKYHTPATTIVGIKKKIIQPAFSLPLPTTFAIPFSTKEPIFLSRPAFVKGIPVFLEIFDFNWDIPNRRLQEMPVLFFLFVPVVVVTVLVIVVVVVVFLGLLDVATLLSKMFFIVI